MTHRGLVSTCHPDLSVFFFGQNRPIFCRGPIGFSQVLGESFPEVIALQSNDEKLVKVAMQLKVFFLSDVVG